MFPRPTLLSERSPVIVYPTSNIVGTSGELVSTVDFKSIYW